MPALQDNQRDIFLKLNSIVRADPGVFSEEEHKLFNQVKQLYVQSILPSVMPSIVDEQTGIPTAPLKVGSQPAYNIEDQAIQQGEAQTKEFLRKLPAGARGFVSGVLFAVQPQEWANALTGVSGEALAAGLESIGKGESANQVRKLAQSIQIPAMRLPASASQKPEDQLVEALLMGVTDINVVSGIAKRIRVVKGEKAAKEFMANYDKAVKELQKNKLLPSGERKALPEGAPIVYGEGEGIARGQQKLVKRPKGVKVPKQKAKVQKTPPPSKIEPVKEPVKKPYQGGPKVLDLEKKGWNLTAEDKIIIKQANKQKT